MKAIFAGQNAPRTLSARAGLLHGVASSFTSVLDHERADSSFGTIPDMSFPLIPLPGMLPDHKKDMGSHMAGSWIAHRLMGQYGPRPRPYIIHGAYWWEAHPEQAEGGGTSSTAS
eukprot:TRINITY_DN11233_c0_g1_i1.p1 TRINITY_DN11233_c0_g1~~TRINITY_DN11233_c0_g1_i1.p1  ORF type:complete len:115 (-),score=18.59 TRINITY_DN11233_c0_g1_i1:205-549(-)